MLFSTDTRLSISLDLDSTLRNQLLAIRTAIYRRYHTKIQLSAFNTWDAPLGHLVGISDDELTSWIWSDPMIFATAQPYPGAVQAVQRLYQSHNITITTSTAHPVLTEPWLDFWGIPYHRVIHTKDKASVEFDWHVDDSPIILPELEAAGRAVIRYALPWNAHLKHLPTIFNWRTICQT